MGKGHFDLAQLAGSCAAVIEQLPTEQQNDPQIREFIERAAQASAQEKQSDPRDWTGEERAAYDAGDWQRFSRLRGYTQAEISNFGRFMELAAALDQRYGADFAQCLDFDIQQTREAMNHDITAREGL